MLKGFRGRLAVRVLPIPGYDAMKIWPAQWERADIHNYKHFGDPTKMRIGGLGSTITTITDTISNILAPRKRRTRIISRPETKPLSSKAAAPRPNEASTLHPPQFHPDYFDIAIWLHPAPKPGNELFTNMSLEEMKKVGENTGLNASPDFKYWSRQDVAVFSRWLENEAIVNELTRSTVDTAKAGIATVPITLKRRSKTQVARPPRRDTTRDALRIRKVSAPTTRIRRVTRSMNRAPGV